MDRRQSIKAVARSTAMGGTFQAALRPVDVHSYTKVARGTDFKVVHCRSGSESPADRS